MPLKRGDVLVKLAGGRSRRVTVLSKPRSCALGTVVDVVAIGCDKQSWVMLLDNGSPPYGWVKEETS